MFPEEAPDFLDLISEDKSILEFMTNLVRDFCLSKENDIRCARYKIKREGKQLPLSLDPDGKNINFVDSIKKQKLVIDEPIISLNNK
jgi:hypothetical protein